MKIVFLNCWNATQREAITDFIKQQSADTDIFCLEEAYEIMRPIADEILADFNGVFVVKRLNDRSTLAQAIYVRKSISLFDSGTLLNEDDGLGICLWAEVSFGPRRLLIGNVHGAPEPADKMEDTPERLKQSEKILAFFNGEKEGIKKSLKIIGGDFNLAPEAKSVRMFAEVGYRNLITECAIPTTRNHLAWDRFPEYKKEYFSDYVFTGPDVSVRSFTVPDVEISDHLPMIMEIGE